MRSMGVFTAESACRVHRIPFAAVRALSAPARSGAAGGGEAAGGEAAGGEAAGGGAADGDGTLDGGDAADAADERRRLRLALALLELSSRVLATSADRTLSLIHI